MFYLLLCEVGNVVDGSIISYRSYTLIIVFRCMFKFLVYYNIGFYAPFYAKKLYKSFELLVVLKSYFTNHLIASRLKNILCFYWRECQVVGLKVCLKNVLPDHMMQCSHLSTIFRLRDFRFPSFLTNCMNESSFPQNFHPSRRTWYAKSWRYKVHSKVFVTITGANFYRLVAFSLTQFFQSYFLLIRFVITVWRKELMNNFSC